VTIDMVDIERREAGDPNPVPRADTTEVELTVNSSRAGSTWSTVANMSIPSVVDGEYAVYVERFLALNGSRNFVGRWPNAPMSAERLRVNMGTSAVTAGLAAVTRVASTGIYLDAGTTFETALAGQLKDDPDTAKPTWVYYPYSSSKFVVQGAAADKVATKRMDADHPVRFIAPPAAPSVSGVFTSYTNDLKLSGQTATYGPFRVRAAFLPETNPKNWEVTNDSTITLTAGTYEVWGTWKLDRSRIIIQGAVKIVVNPNLLRRGLDWKDSSIELESNATLEIYNGYSAKIENCWMGARFICTSEASGYERFGDPHRNWWFGVWKMSSCSKSVPSSPMYIEPWRIRMYPIGKFLSSTYSWDIQDSCLVAAIFLPTNTLNCSGRTQIYGRVAVRDLVATDTASFYYDHALDEVSGLTEGMSPERGGDPDQMFPVRIIRFGFEADSAQ
jgi:hypothetical protein